MRKKKARKLTKKQYGYLTKHFKDSCIICDKTSVQNKKALAVDHCHKTGKLRGLLCTPCNLGLGMFRDDTRLLKNAINYLKRKPIIDGIIHVSTEKDVEPIIETFEEYQERILTLRKNFIEYGRLKGVKYTKEQIGAFIKSKRNPEM